VVLFGGVAGRFFSPDAGRHAQAGESNPASHKRLGSAVLCELLFASVRIKDVTKNTVCPPPEFRYDAGAMDTAAMTKPITIG